MDGYVFSPSMASIDSTGGTASKNFTALAAEELIANGGFETAEAWSCRSPGMPLLHTLEGARAGRSVLTGIT
jgi:hypothetical protein